MIINWDFLKSSACVGEIDTLTKRVCFVLLVVTEFLTPFTADLQGFWHQQTEANGASDLFIALNAGTSVRGCLADSK